MTGAIGDDIPTFKIEVTTASIKFFAGVLRDPNPIHLDPAAVRAKGLGEGQINQGPANLAYVINALTAAFPTGAIESLDIRFVDNVFAGETVEAAGKIIDIIESTDLRRATCEVWLRVIGRGLVLSGQAVVSQPFIVQTRA